jgi:hypothetical protein
LADGVATGTANTAVSDITANALWIQLHFGAPGSAGTANPSSVTTRIAVTWGTISGATVSASNSPAWAGWAGTNGEVVTDISFWSAATGGTFVFSMHLNPSVTMNLGDSLTLTSLQVNIPTAS